MPARTGEGLTLTQLPTAQFDPSGNPMGLAKDRGWRCVNDAGEYSSAARPSACPRGEVPRVITGLYPDQVWVDGQSLIQVADKSLVRPGYFYVVRSHGTDASPGPSRAYLHQQDAQDMGKVRVSDSSGNFLIVSVDGVRLEGLQIRNHSPAWPFFALDVAAAVDDLVVRDVELDSVASIAVKYAGGSARDGSGLGKRSTFDRLTIRNAGWIGASMLYVDDVVVSSSSITGANQHAEFNTAPKSGGIKATKTHRMKVVDSEVSGNHGHGIWWDQSNYDAVLANSQLRGNTDSAVFYEISHGLTMVNNTLTRGDSPSSSPTVRMAGASGVRLVNNTIVGGQTPIALAADPRSKKYGPNQRLCAEHTSRYGQGGSISADCPPALSSDLDMARAGAFGGSRPNQTPGLTWRPSAKLLLNNVIANPIPGSGGICPGGYPLCVKTYAGSASNANPAIAPSEVLIPGLVANGNVYQGPSTVAQILVPSGSAGGLKASTLDQLRGPNGLASSVYRLAAESQGIAGQGFVATDGVQTDKLAALHAGAAPVPVDATINAYLPAGTRHYGALRTQAVAPPPEPLPIPVFSLRVNGRTVQVDAAGSQGSQRTKIKVYRWDFGDDTGVSTGQQNGHVYAAPGTYQIALTVIDQKGAYDTLVKKVTITDPAAAAFADDSFNRDVAAGLGTADKGGSWTVVGSSANYRVDGAMGVLKLAPGTSRQAALRSAVAPAAEVKATIGVSALPVGGPANVALLSRVATDGSAYRAKVSVRPDGTASLQLTRTTAAGAETVMKTSTTVVRGITADSRLMVVSDVNGSGPSTLRAKMWRAGQPEPAWQVTTTDSTATLQSGGYPGVFSYLSRNAASGIDLLVDDFESDRPVR